MPKIPGTGVSAPRRSPERRQLAAIIFAIFLLVAYAAANSKLSKGEKRAAAAGVIVLMLFIALIGEFSQEIAVGFSGLILVALLVGGPTNVFGYLTKTLPTNFIKSAGG